MNTSKMMGHTLKTFFTHSLKKKKKRDFFGVRFSRLEITSKQASTPEQGSKQVTGQFSSPLKLMAWKRCQITWRLGLDRAGESREELAEGKLNQAEN